MSDHLRNVDLDIRELTGMTYNLLTKVYKLGRNVDVNYMMHAKDTREA
jgi:2-polyprenyl-6-hydroxyphenyl methylase/3-demethylubiquinone-9 3-methyltransferase